MTWPVYERDQIRVYKVEDEYVVSQYGTWLPGAYSSIEAAIDAASVMDDVLYRAYARGVYGSLTLANVHALKGVKNV